MSSRGTEVSAGTTIFDLLKPETGPAYNSDVVLAEKNEVLKAVDLPLMVGNMKSMGTLIRIATDGARVALDAKLVQDVTDLGITITQLTRDANVTMLAYELLLDGCEDIALEELSSLAKYAEAVVAVISRLKGGFEAAEKRTGDLVGRTEKEKVVAEKRKQEAEQERTAMEAEQKLKEEVAKEFKRVADEQAAQALKADEEGKSGPSLADSLVDGLAAGFLGINTGRRDAALAKAKAARDRAESLQKFREEQDKLASLAHNLAKNLSEAMHDTRGALRKILGVLSDALVFWSQLLIFSEKNMEGATNLHKIVSSLQNKDEEKRKEMYLKSPVKNKFAMLYVQWTAMGAIATDYRAELESAYGDLKNYLEENPTMEESKSNLKRLAQTLVENVTEQMKMIADRTVALQKEGETAKKEE
ncbi:hypothetical protein BJ742DRAFT_766467 [Cladochytrium replicatum]|nr:hypothetical protein BJ742DRAFT_766467 [Cladochytrium replicatum]